MIEGKNWDGVRNVVKTPPLANVKALIKTYAKELGDAGDDLMAPREDFVQAVQFLDTFVYNNIFISEQNGVQRNQCAELGPFDSLTCSQP